MPSEMATTGVEKASRRKEYEVGLDDSIDSVD